MTAVLFVTFAVLLLLNVPIAFSLFISSMTALIYADYPLTVVIQRSVTAVDSFILLAIPFFMVAGNLMTDGGISKRVMNFANSSVGFARGGLAHVNILTSMLFAGITGAAAADTSAVGAVLIPAMKKEKYDSDFSAAVTASSSVIGVIIPPSIPFVIYGVIGGVSIGKLFLGGVIPGIMIGFSQLGISYFICKKHNYGKMKKFSVVELYKSFFGGFFALLMPVIILGGIMAGVVTPTEAAVLATVYATVIGFFVYKQLSLKKMPALLLESAKTTATVMFMIAGAYLYGWIITNDQLPQKVCELVTSISSSQHVVLFMCVVVFFIVGMFIDLSAGIILMVPVLFPLTKAMGIDPIVFGVVTVISLAIGLITPPVGVCLFIASEISQAPLLKVAKKTIAYIVGILIVLFLIIMYPEIVLFVPNYFMS